MNTKTFAQLARRNLLDGVAKKLLFWGFDEKGIVLEEPISISGGYLLRGEPYDDTNVPVLWKALKKAIQRKGIDVVLEEAAYTWFNRMLAIKIMAKNGYEEAQLDYAEGMKHTPLLLQRARQGHTPYLKAGEKARLEKIIGDYNKDKEAFALLLVGYCHSNKMLNNVFGRMDDYTELLLPDNMLQDSGFLHLLNTTDAISDEQYKEVELIGWLYQFYISERKDEVFASFKKNKKAEAKDIPAATQIFTPNWIVKYMVQNTVGKIWLDKNPNSKIKPGLKYLVENESDSTSEPIISEVSQLTLIDPAAGSGHILVEGFDLLYQMYMEEYYTPEEAVESILKNNLFGLDIDDRAEQLATFAILLKAAKQYQDVFAKGWLPNVYAMPEYATFSEQEIKDFLGTDGTAYEKELAAALRLMEQAKNLGSVMKLNISDKARTFIEKRFTELKNTDYRDFNTEIVFQKIKTFIPVLLLLSKKYTSVVANPPYMGSGNMNDRLKNYLNANYPLSKSDLFAVFMESCLFIAKKGGLMGMINQQSWMFLSSYEKLREHILDNYGIVNMLHLGPRTFEELSGEVVQSTAFVIQNDYYIKKGRYYRLVDYKNVNEKRQYFLERKNEYTNIIQNNFSKIPGSPIAYWVSENVRDLFENGINIGNKSAPRRAIQSGDGERFLKNWFEISNNDIEYNSNSKNLLLHKKKWFRLSNGGVLKKWYGNIDFVIKWDKNGAEIKATGQAIIPNEDLYFKECISWNRISGNGLAFRFHDDGILCGDASPFIYSENYLIELLGFTNSILAIYFLKCINPTLAVQTGSIAKLPFIELSSFKEHNLVLANVEIAKHDDNSRETSWGFKKSQFLNEKFSIKLAYKQWQIDVTNDFFHMHKNEEELNLIFIDIYGLQDELTPEVALKDITILQDELKKNDLEALEEKFRTHGKDAIELPINRGEVISQFISYAIGLFMGRYRLDKPGLNIAHPYPTKEELASYNYNHGEVIIDPDAILPIMGKNCNFNDDVVKQFSQLLDTIWGHEQRTESINFIQECLDKELEKFLVNDFWKYHCGMYKKTPIYWLFSSKKGAFQVLVYMHRMNEFTVEKIRANYLLEHLKYLKSEIAQKEANVSSLSTVEARQLDKLRADLVECEQYDMELKNVADQQIKFDLDDGVTKNYKLFESVLAKI